MQCRIFLKKIKKNSFRNYYQNLNDMLYSSWDIEQNILKLLILGHFLPFYPLKTVEIKISKNKKFAGDIIILHMYTKNHNQVTYGSWNMERDGQNSLSFWTNFCCFTPLSNQKNKIFKNWKKILEILSFYTFVPKVTIIWCMVLEIWSMILDRFSLFYSPTTQKVKILKNFKKNKTWNYYQS